MDRAGQGARASISGAGLLTQGRRHGLSQTVAVGGIGNELAFLSVAEIAEFQEHTRNHRVSREAQAAADHATISGTSPACRLHGALATHGQSVAVHAPIVGFRPADGWSTAIEVQADQDGSTLSVGESNSIVQIHKAIVMTQQDRIELAVELAADALGHVQGKVFFFLACVGAHSPRVFAAVSGIEKDRTESLRTRAMPPFIEPMAGGG
jgi:hypothetical protein